MKLAILQDLLDCKTAQIPAALLTDLGTGEQDIVTLDSNGTVFSLSSDDLVKIRQALIDDHSSEMEIGQKRLFVQVHNPPKRLMIVGAVHISQGLAPMAALAGYQVIVIDPRRSFASALRFPNTELRHDWPDEALAALKPDRRSAVVTLTHDPKLDDPALATALRSPVFYIGALGSRKTHAARVERLIAAGFSVEDIERIHGPAGLDIGAQSPAEIAVSVLAQMTAALHHKPTGRS